MSLAHPSPRLLVIPGLHDSGPAHWQTWLQSLYRGAERVQQRDWSDPQLQRWADRIGRTLELAGGQGPWVAAAHSFGCLALARHLADRPDSPIRAALLVAPAEPDKFGLAARLPAHSLPVSTTLISSDTDPWMSAASARRWAARWGAHLVSLGDVGHINAEAGFGPLPRARRWVDAQLARQARLAREQRPGQLCAGPPQAQLPPPRGVIAVCGDQGPQALVPSCASGHSRCDGRPAHF